MMKHRQPSWEGLRIVVCTLLAVCFSVGQAAGQSRQSGEIRGTVTDATGAVVPGVTITLTNVATGVVQRLTTDATGLYDAPFVPLGQYIVTFAKEGFEKFVRDNVDMRLETITLNAQLQVGAATQSITVNAPVALVQTENAEQSTTLTSTPVTELPNVGASWYNLLALIPGVNQGGAPGGYGGAYGSNVGVNGMGGLNSNWQVDGGRAFLVMDANPDWMQPALDDIQEIKMLTANFGAEYGNGTSVFNVVTKSGTNHFHGDAFEYVENDKLDAANYFTVGAKTPLRWNKFGGSIGGPIKRDKLFFHFNYQQNTNINDIPSFATYPTASMLEGNFNDPAFQTIYNPATLTEDANGNYSRTAFPNNIITTPLDPVSEKIAANFPLPNLPNAGIYNNFYWVNRETQPGKWINTKIDYNITPSQRLTGNIEIVPAGLGYPAPDPLIDNDAWVIHEYQSEITDVWTISPRVVAEFRVSIAREYGAYQTVSQGKGWPATLGLANPVANMFPYTTIEGSLSTTIGTSGSGLDTEVGYGPSADFTWVKGKHVIKWGGELTKDWLNSNGSQEGAFDFDGLFTGNPSLATPGGEGFADFLLGLPDTWGVSDNPTTGERMWTTQPFIQDEFKIRPNLTLTGGVRWIIQSGFGEAFNRISNFDPTLINASTGTPGAMTYAGKDWTHLQNTHFHFFAPRVGFAWSPKKDWSIRGGYGIFSILWSQYNYGNNVAQGWGITGYETSTDLIHPIFTMQQGPPAPLYPTSATLTNDFLNGQSVGYNPPNMPMGYNQQYRLDVQHQFKGGVLVDAAYVGNRSLHMPGSGNWRDLNQVPQSLLGVGSNFQLNRPFPQFATITDYDPVDYGEYNAFQFTAKKDMGHGLMFSANYSWSHALDTMTGNAGTGAPAYWQDAYTPSADYGGAATDERHVFNGEFIYRFPVGHGQHFLNRGGIGDAVLGGWELTSVFTARTGTPFTPMMGTTNLSGALSGGWRPNRIASGKVASPSINEWFDPSAFVSPASYTFGNSGRDILYGPPFHDVDFALMKKFPITAFGEGGNLAIKAETYDAFDSPNFNLPNASIGVAGAGVISQALDNRLIQLGMTLNF